MSGHQCFQKKWACYIRANEYVLDRQRLWDKDTGWEERGTSRRGPARSWGFVYLGVLDTVWIFEK